MSFDFNDLFGGGGFPKAPASKPSKPAPEKGVQLHGRRIGGAYYLRAADVAALLTANDVLPGIAKKLQSIIDPTEGAQA